MPLKSGEVQKDVSVTVTGGLRFATVAVEAQSVPLTKRGSAFKGTKSKAVLKPSDGISFGVWFKGGHNASWELAVTINKEVWKTSGHVIGGSYKDTLEASAADFKLNEVAV